MILNTHASPLLTLNLQAFQNMTSSVRILSKQGISTLFHVFVNFTYVLPFLGTGSSHSTLTLSNSGSLNPSVNLPSPATILRFLARAPSPAPPPPSPTPSPASPSRNRPRHRRSPLEPLEALLHRRSASPVILRSNRLWEWNRGESLGPLGLCPPPVVRRRRR